MLAWHPDRLHRRPVELESFIDLVEKTGLRISTAQSGEWDLSTPSGRAVARTVGAWARYESEHKGRRIAEARKQGARAGRHHGGVRPYGFEKDGMTVRQREAEEIRNAAVQLVSGASLRAIVRSLNDRGVPTAAAADDPSRKTRWTGQTLRGILLSPRVAGLSSWHGEVVGPAGWPEIISEGEWRAVTAVLSNPSRRTTTGPGPRWLGSGLYVCGVCNERTLRVGTSTGGRRTYRCSRRGEEATTGHVTREAESLDRYVQQVAVRYLKTEGVLSSLLTPTGAGVDVDALRAERVLLEERLAEQAVLHAQGMITARQMIAGSEVARRRLVEIEEVIAAQFSRSVFATLADVPDLDVAWFGEAGEGGLSLGLRRAVLDELMTVTVQPAPRGPVFQPGFITIDWK